MTKSDYFKSDYFVFNAILLKKINSYDLSYDEFILLIYLLNFNVCTLDLNNIEKKCFISKKRALSAFNGLIEKGIVVLTMVEDENGLLNEEISLDDFLNNEDKDDTDSNDTLDFLVKSYEKVTNTNVNEEEKIIFNAWLDSYNKDLIIKAIKEAQYNGLCNLRYIDKLLYEWANNCPDNGNNNELETNVGVINNKTDDNWLDE